MFDDLQVLEDTFQATSGLIGLIGFGAAKKLVCKFSNKMREYFTCGVPSITNLYAIVDPGFAQ